MVAKKEDPKEPEPEEEKTARLEKYKAFLKEYEEQALNAGGDVKQPAQPVEPNPRGRLDTSHPDITKASDYFRVFGGHRCTGYNDLFPFLPAPGQFKFGPDNALLAVARIGAVAGHHEPMPVVLHLLLANCHGRILHEFGPSQPQVQFKPY